MVVDFPQWFLNVRTSLSLKVNFYKRKPLFPQTHTATVSPSRHIWSCPPAPVEALVMQLWCTGRGESLYFFYVPSEVVNWGQTCKQHLTHNMPTGFQHGWAGLCTTSSEELKRKKKYVAINFRSSLSNSRLTSNNNQWQQQRFTHSVTFCCFIWQTNFLRSTHMEFKMADLILQLQLFPESSLINFTICIITKY